VLLVEQNKNIFAFRVNNGECYKAALMLLN